MNTGVTDKAVTGYICVSYTFTKNLPEAFGLFPSVSGSATNIEFAEFFFLGSQRTFRILYDCHRQSFL